MIRKILCPECAGKEWLDPRDARDGWQLRKVALKAHVPEDHGLTIDGVFKPLKTILCDHCAAKISDGDPASAVTMWRGEGVPHNWEKEYAKI